MKSLSIRAPWWWYILHGGKDIENRDRQSSVVTQRYLGPVWVHVGKFWRPSEVYDDVCAADAMQALAAGDFAQLTDWRRLELCCGCIVGSVEIAGYVTASPSPWFVGDVGLVLRNPVPLATPVPCKGQLGFFDIPAGLIGESA
jgi:hypothetical protein